MRTANSIPHTSHHWPFLLRRRRSWHGVSTSQIIASQVFTVVASVLAGFLLDVQKESFATMAGALLLLPGIIDLAASLAGAMCAKINHRIDVGSDSAARVAMGAIAFALIVSVLAGIIIGLVAGAIGALFFEASWSTVALLSVVSMIAIGVVSYPGLALFTLLLRKLGMNPDNIAGPVESSIIDVVAVVIVAWVVGLL